MSSRVLRGPPRKGRVKDSGKMVLDLDLNTPPVGHRDDEGTSGVQEGVQQGGESLPPTIDVEEIDDEVVISSPRSFIEARNNSRRVNGRTVVIDTDLELTTRQSFTGRNKRRKAPANQAFINCDQYINLDSSSSSKGEPPVPPPPKEPTFSCPICMSKLVDETSTKCGHIFCKECINAAVSAQSKCPTCRKKVTMRDTFRIYLPATSL